MGFLNRLFGKQRDIEERAGHRLQRQTAATSTTEVPPCPHTAITARWESVADMGKEDKATGYTCQGCGQSFTAAEGRTLRATEAERVQHELATPEQP